MGWWAGDEEGGSLYEESTGIIWGDEPADIFDEALEQIVKAFEREWKRKPTQVELIAGLKFSMAGDFEDPVPPRRQSGKARTSTRRTR